MASDPAGSASGTHGPVQAVVFDWGGTLTPYHAVELRAMWRPAARMLAPRRAEEVADALAAAERDWWQEVTRDGRSGTTSEVVDLAAERVGLRLPPEVRAAAVSAHLEAWTPHTLTDPEAGPVLSWLRAQGIRTGLLSNTHWPSEWHDRWLDRDGVLELFDARIYTSAITTTKPHPSAFKAVLDALDVPAECSVFVGDRPFDDIFGAQRAGMRTVLMPNDAVPAYDVTPDAVIHTLHDLQGLVMGWNRPVHRRA